MYIEYNDNQKTEYLINFDLIKKCFIFEYVAYLLLLFFTLILVSVIYSLIVKNLLHEELPIGFLFWMSVLFSDIGSFKKNLKLNKIMNCSLENVKILRCCVKELENRPDDKPLYWGNIVVDDDKIKGKIEYIDVSADCSGLQVGNKVDVVMLDNKPVIATHVL